MADPNPELVEKVVGALCLVGDDSDDDDTWRRKVALAAIRIAGEWAAGVAENVEDWVGEAAVGSQRAAAAIRREFGVSND